MSTTTDGLRVVIAAEQAAVWAYSLVGGKVAAPLQASVASVQGAHQRQVVDLASRLRAAGGVVPDPAAAYDPPFAVTGTPSALRFAVHLEDGVAAAWRYLVAAAESPDLRRRAATMLAATAVQSARWRRRTALPAAQAFPGT